MIFFNNLKKRTNNGNTQTKRRVNPFVTYVLTVGSMSNLIEIIEISITKELIRYTK